MLCGGTTQVFLDPLVLQDPVVKRGTVASLDTVLPTMLLTVMD